MISCNSTGGKVSNNFGTNLGIDLDSDGDKDAAVVINNIAGGNDDIGNSIYIDNKGKIYVTGWSYNGRDMYVLKIE
jgi:hypothetical protein